MNEERVTLVFTDERDLRRFHGIIGSQVIELNTRELFITCNCSGEDIELAIKAFRAKVASIKK